MSSNESSSFGEQEGTQSSAESEPQDDTQCCRRARSEAQWPTDKIVVTTLGEDGMPIAKNEKQRMRKLAGLIARQKVSLILPNFNSLKKEGMQNLFEDHVIPYLEFIEEMKPIATKQAMKAIAKCWRNHKSKLLNEFLLKNRSPFDRFKYLKMEDWTAFVELKNTDMFKQQSKKMKQLREKNKHPHRLGTAGYDGIIPKWQAEDARLASEGRSNPWLQFLGRSQSWLHARGTLTDSGEISFKSRETKEVSDKIKEYSEDSSCNGEREDDALSKVLGNLEHSGRVRGFSSYEGWKLGWPGYKKKRTLSDIDMESLTQNIRAQVTQDILPSITESLRAQVTQDILANIPNSLAAQGFKMVQISPSPNQVSPADAYRSSCGSIGNGEHDLYAEMMQHATGGNDPDSIDLLSEPTQCALMGNIGGYPVEVARGQIYPLHKVLHSMPIREDCAVVFVDYVCSKHRKFKLEFPPNDEIVTLKHALLQRIQWSRTRIVINPMEMEALDPENTLASQPKPLEQSKANHVAKCDLPLPHKQQQARSAMNDSEAPQKKAKVTSTTPASAPKCAMAASTAFGGAARTSKKPGLPKAPTSSAPHGNATKSSKKAVASAWAMTNPKFKYGDHMMGISDLEKAGPSCISLHTFYLNGCSANKKNFPISFKC